MNFLKPAVGKS